MTLHLYVSLLSYYDIMLLLKGCWKAWKIQRAGTRMIHGMEKPDLQRAVAEVHSIKFTKYKVLAITTNTRTA